MREDRFFEEGTVPEWTTPEWYAEREAAPHLEQGVHRPRLEMAAEFAKRVGWSWGYKSCVDLGAGDGGLLQLLKQGTAFKAWGYDLQESNVLAAKMRGVDVRYGNVLSDAIEWGEVAISTEMIEHLVDPHGYVKMVRRNAKALIASSPWTDTIDSHIQFHAWGWDMEGYARMLKEAGWDVIDHRQTGIFQVAVCV